MANINDINNPFHQQRDVGAVFHPVPLPPPEDWVPGLRLFPREVIAGYHADYKDYNADSWGKYILEKAEGFKEASSCASWSGERFFLLGLTRTCRTKLMSRWFQLSTVANLNYATGLVTSSVAAASVSKISRGRKESKALAHTGKLWHCIISHIYLNQNFR